MHLYSPEEPLLYRNRIQDMAIDCSNASSLPAVLTSSKLALLDHRMPGSAVLEWAHQRDPKTHLRISELRTGRDEGQTSLSLLQLQKRRSLGSDSRDVDPLPDARRILLYSSDNPWKTMFTFSSTTQPTRSLLSPYQVPSQTMQEPALAVTSIPSLSGPRGAAGATVFELSVGKKLYSSTWASGSGVDEVQEKTVYWDEDVFDLNKTTKLEETNGPSKRYDGREAYERKRVFNMDRPVSHGEAHACLFHTVLFEPLTPSQKINDCLESMSLELLERQDDAMDADTRLSQMQTALELAIMAGGQDSSRSSVSPHPLQPPSQDTDQVAQRLDRLKIWDEAPHELTNCKTAPQLSNLHHAAGPEHHAALFHPKSHMADMAQQMRLEEALSHRVLSSRPINMALLASRTSAGRSSTQVLGRFPKIEDTPNLAFGLLGPKDLPDEGRGSMAARLLLSEWDVSRNAKDVSYQNPYEPSPTGADPGQQDQDESQIQSSYQPTSFSQPLPSARRANPSTLKALRSVRIQEPSRPVPQRQQSNLQSLPSTFEFSQESSQPSQSQEVPPPAQVFSQIVPGQFGARQQRTAAPVKKKKRKAGF